MCVWERREEWCVCGIGEEKGGVCVWERRGEERGVCMCKGGREGGREGVCGEGSESEKVCVSESVYVCMCVWV